MTSAQWCFGAMLVLAAVMELVTGYSLTLPEVALAFIGFWWGQQHEREAHRQRIDTRTPDAQNGPARGVAARIPSPGHPISSPGAMKGQP